jgi:hypothetical protein
MLKCSWSSFLYHFSQTRCTYDAERRPRDSRRLAHSLTWACIPEDDSRVILGLVVQQEGSLDHIFPSPSLDKVPEVDIRYVPLGAGTRASASRDRSSTRSETLSATITVEIGTGPSLVFVQLPEDRRWLEMCPGCQYSSLLGPGGIGRADFPRKDVDGQGESRHGAQHYVDEGTCRSYGRGLLQSYLRAQGYIAREDDLASSWCQTPLGQADLQDHTSTAG